MPAVASETKVAPFSPAPATRTASRASDGGDMFSALVDDSAPPEERSGPSSRSAKAKTDAPARDRGTNQADDKSAAADTAGDAPAKAKSDDTSAASTDTKAASKGDGKTDAKTTIDGAAEQAAADAATTTDGTVTDVQTDPSATVIPIIAAVVPTAPTAIAPAGDAVAADPLLAANPAIGEIATPILKPQQATGDAGQAQQTAPAVDPSATDAASNADAGKPAAIPAAAPGKPGDAAEAKPAAPAATPDDHPATARHAADATANDATAIKTDPTQTPQTLHTAQPANGTAPAGPAHTATNTAAASQPVPLHAVAVEIAARAGTGKNRFEIRLDPPELGKIDVRLDIDKHGQVTSRLIVEKAETLDLLRRDAPQLERALQDAGLKTSGNGLQFSLQQQMSQQRDDQPSGHAATAQMLVTDETAATDIAARSYSSLAAARGGIDIRV